MFGDGAPTKAVLAALRAYGVKVSDGDPTVIERDGIIESHYFYDTIPREQLEYLARKFGVGLNALYGQ